MNTEQCIEVLREKRVYLRLQLENPYQNGDPSGEVRREINALSHALTVLENLTEEKIEEILANTPTIVNDGDIHPGEFNIIAQAIIKGINEPVHL